jgi:hypothetical protein
MRAPGMLARLSGCTPRVGVGESSQERLGSCCRKMLRGRRSRVLTAWERTGRAQFRSMERRLATDVRLARSAGSVRSAGGEYASRRIRIVAWLMVWAHLMERPGWFGRSGRRRLRVGGEGQVAGVSVLGGNGAAVNGRDDGRMSEEAEARLWTRVECEGWRSDVEMGGASAVAGAWRGAGGGTEVWPVGRSKMYGLRKASERRRMMSVAGEVGPCVAVGVFGEDGWRTGCFGSRVVVDAEQEMERD